MGALSAADLPVCLQDVYQVLHGLDAHLQPVFLWGENMELTTSSSKPKQCYQQHIQPSL